MKKLATVLILAFLAGCGQGEGMLLGSLAGGGELIPGPTAKVTVLNGGTQSVRVVTSSKSLESSTNDVNHDDLLAPSASLHYTVLDVKTLTIEAWRTSDSVEILSESWNSGDLSLDENVNVTLTP